MKYSEYVKRMNEAVPHGPEEPCTCSGCWACKGRVIGCTCDIDWDEMFSLNRANVEDD